MPVLFIPNLLRTVSQRWCDGIVKPILDINPSMGSSDLPGRLAATAGRLRRVATGCLALILLAAIGVVLRNAGVHGEKAFNAKLDELLPRKGELPGWTVSHQPIAETEEMKRAVAEQLNYDDAVYAIYAANGLRISVYAAYWTPGKMPYRMIATHTPDVCWVGGGWKCLVRGTQLMAASERSKPLEAEHRVFELGGISEHVIFCHFASGKLLRYETEAHPPWYAMFADVFRTGVHQRGEQLFFRISSNRPYGEFKDALPFRIFVERFTEALSLSAHKKASAVEGNRS